MRGEHCIAGASVLSAIAIILLIFANLGQISTGALVSGIYFAQVNTAPYGAALVAKTKSSADGLYDTKNEALGKGLGLRQNYRFGIYSEFGDTERATAATLVKQSSSCLCRICILLTNVVLRSCSYFPPLTILQHPCTDISHLPLVFAPALAPPSLLFSIL